MDGSGLAPSSEGPNFSLPISSPSAVMDDPQCAKDYPGLSREGANPLSLWTGTIDNFITFFSGTISFFFLKIGPLIESCQ